MAIPYNPSSFATNKTILQAIEELKNYLKDNPCYKVYYVNTPYVVGTYTYNLSDVDDPDDTMTEYDVVFFTNSYYAKVIVKDSTTFDIDPAVSFKGATGNTGPAGADGSDGVSITGATINASGHLIISLSNGNTVDAGAMPQATISYITLTSSSGTLTDSEYALLSDRNTYFIYEYSDYKIELRFKYENSTYLVYEDTHYTHNSVYARMFLLITKGTKAYAYSSTTRPFTENDINSISGTSGQVLTAGGDGTASWTTISAGYDNTVSITATSGTFSDSDFAKLGYGDSTIIYTDTYSVSTVYKLKLETASILEFEAIDAASRTNLKLIDVNKTTKAYSMTAVSMITSSTISSGTATSGKVLTANGSGGCSWETAGGTLYQHNIHIVDTSTNKAINIILSIINKSSTQFTYNTLNTWLADNGFTTGNPYIAQGLFKTQYVSIPAFVIGLVGDSQYGIIGANFITISSSGGGTENNIVDSTITSFTDTVITI